MTYRIGYPLTQSCVFDSLSCAFRFPVLLLSSSRGREELLDVAWKLDRVTEREMLKFVRVLGAAILSSLLSQSYCL